MGSAIFWCAKSSGLDNASCVAVDRGNRDPCFAAGFDLLTAGGGAVSGISSSSPNVPARWRTAERDRAWRRL